MDPLNSCTVRNVSIKYVSGCLAVWLHLQEIRASHPSSTDGFADGFFSSPVECAGSTVEAAATSDDFSTLVFKPKRWKLYQEWQLASFTNESSHGALLFYRAGRAWQASFSWWPFDLLQCDAFPRPELFYGAFLAAFVVLMQ